MCNLKPTLMGERIKANKSPAKNEYAVDKQVIEKFSIVA